MLSDDGGVNWATGWQPYHPTSENYTQVGDMKHWIMNDPGGPSQESVNSAFAQSIAENRPVVYGWYMHQRDDMKGLVASAHTMLQAAALANPGVTFKYVTAQEAMRGVIGTTDVTPPALTVAPAGGDGYMITSTETLLGDGPYVAGRYGSGSGAVYAHVTVTPGATNTWTATLPSLNGVLPLELVGAGALDLAGNSAVATWNICAPGGPVAAVTGLASAPAPSGNGGSGRTKTVLTWSGGGGGTVKVYRKGYSNGSYPAYPVVTPWPPAAPASPTLAEAAGWAPTTVHASGEMDQPPTRDYWSYVAFNTDDCGSSSAASNVTSGALDYLLGDVSDGTTACAGDNAVKMADLSLLGMHYGAPLGSEYLACLDVGPTVGYSLTGRPAPDGQIEFEDLVLFALNFTPGSAPLASARPARTEGAAAGADALTLEVPTLPAVGGSFTVGVRATAGGLLQALKLELGYDRAVLEMEGAEAGELLGRQGAQALVLTPGPGRVDVALLGAGTGLYGSGELVQVRFRVKSAGAAALALKSAEGRDGANRKVALNGQAGVTPPQQLPTKTWFAAPAPNPFSRATTLSFALARGGAVELGVYGIDGRKVATLVNEAREPGQYQASWDGRDGTGQPVRPGIYYARLMTPEGRFTRTLVLMR